MLHVNPALKEKGLLAVFNPLNQAVTKSLAVNLYYTGLTDTAKITGTDGGPGQTLKLKRDYTIDLPVTVPAQGMAWWVIE